MTPTVPRTRRHAMVDAVRWILLALLLAAIAVAVWIVVELMTVRDHLAAAQNSITSLEVAVRTGDRGSVDRAVSATARAAHDAEDASNRLPLRVAAAVPWVGAPVDSVRQLSGAADRLAATALPQASTAAQAVFAEPLVDRGRVDLSALNSARPSVTAALDAVTTVRREVQSIGSDTWSSEVNSAVREFRAKLNDLRGQLTSADRATRLLPTMLGSDGPRTIAVVVQNPAEARATGGLPGALFVLTADDGRVQQRRTVSDLAVPPGRAIDLGSDYEKLYGEADPTTLWQNSNLSPHFPYAAQIWRSLTRQQTGLTPDIVVGIDPTVLAGILGAIGPVRLDDGTTVTSENIVQITESTAYRRFDDRRSARKDYLGQIAAAAVDRLTAGRFDLGTLGRSSEAAVTQGRISVWSARAAEEAELSTTTLAHQIPYSPAPYAEVVVNNAYGSKLDYYLERDVDYRYGLCSADRQLVRVDATLTNAVPVAAIPTLSPEVLGTYLPGSGGLPKGTNRVAVYLYSSWDSAILRVLVNGEPVGFGTGVELGHLVTFAVVTLPPQTPVTVRFEVTEKRSDVPVDLQDQALTGDLRSVVTGTSCGAPQ
ncbi:DUF4012 domain-containing protein [Williamsia sp. SKLECPSW1]